MAGLRWVLAPSAALCLTLLPSASYAAALPLVRAAWGVTATEAGFIFSAYQIGYVVATLILLPLTDRVDTRWLIGVSALPSAAGNALLPLWANDFVSGSLLRLVTGVPLVGVYVPGMRVIAEHFTPELRGGPMGLYVASFYVGTNVSVLLTGILLPTLGWRGAYLTAVVLAALSPIGCWLALRRRKRTQAKRASGRLDLTVPHNRPALLTITGYAAHTVGVAALLLLRRDPAGLKLASGRC